MTRPLPEDDRAVELDDDRPYQPLPDEWEPRTGTSTDDDRRLLDERPPHWG